MKPWRTEEQAVSVSRQHRLHWPWWVQKESSRCHSYVFWLTRPSLTHTHTHTPVPSEPIILYLMRAPSRASLTPALTISAFSSSRFVLQRLHVSDSTDWGRISLRSNRNMLCEWASMCPLMCWEAVSDDPRTCQEMMFCCSKAGDVTQYVNMIRLLHFLPGKMK